MRPARSLTLLVLLALAGHALAITRHRTKIQQILHHVYLGGEAQLSPEWRHWRDACRALHHEWSHFFWDAQSADRLVQKSYPWLYAHYSAIERVVERGDVLRPLILHRFGGVYLDSDVQCVHPLDPFLAGYTAVIQGSREGHEVVSNYAMAAEKDEPLMLAMLHAILTRHKVAAQHPEWTKDWSVIWRTGPMMVKETLQAYVGESDPEKMQGSTYTVNGSVVHVYPRDQWVRPISYPEDEEGSRKASLEALAAGRTPLNVAGLHRSQATWWTNT